MSDGPSTQRSRRPRNGLGFYQSVSCDGNENADRDNRRSAQKQNLKFEIVGASFDVREAFAVWRLGIVRVRREEVRNSRGHNQDHDSKIGNLRGEWRLLQEVLPSRRGAPMKEEQAWERPSNHANAPQKLRQKAYRQKRATELKARLASIPKSVHAARVLYLKLCESQRADLDAEMQEVIDGLKGIVGRRGMAKAAAPSSGTWMPLHVPNFFADTALLTAEERGALIYIMLAI